jgi:hypothetical protein
MGKALLINRPSAVLVSGQEKSLLGDSSATTTELNTQTSCTEAAIFSNLRANIISGGSGTNNFRFRDAGADGSGLATIAGAGIAEDLVNTDTLSAADLFNIAYTDTGSSSTITWMTANVEFSSGHGNFHGCASYAGQVLDVASETRFFGLAGALLTDGAASEATVAWKVRGYTSFEAFQVRVTANARTNTSTFKNRINAGDGTGQIDFTAGATGLLSDTGLADAISDGQQVSVSVTLDTGVEDLTITLIVGTFKSSSSKSETFLHNDIGIARAASSTAHYVTPGGAITNLTAQTETQARIRPGFAAVVSNLRCYLSANTYTVDGTLKLYQNGVAVITTTITASGGAAWYENTADSITIDADDELSFEFDEGTSGSITVHSVGITFAPSVAVSDPTTPIDPAIVMFA